MRSTSTSGMFLMREYYCTGGIFSSLLKSRRAEIRRIIPGIYAVVITPIEAQRYASVYTDFAR